jgi:hypothetical protein
MSDEVMTELDRQIQKALAVDPSPDFQARVRIRLREEPPRNLGGLSWLVSGVVGLAAAALIAVFVSSRQGVGPRAADPVPPAAHTAAVPDPIPVAATERPAVERLPAVTRHDAAEAVLVPAAEREAFRRFLRTVAENGLAYSVPDASEDTPLSVAEIMIEPIVIAPIDTSAE